jgi:hypothetical protein
MLMNYQEFAAILFDEEGFAFLMSSVARDRINLGTDGGHQGIVGFEVIKIGREGDNIIGVRSKLLAADGLDLDWTPLPFDNPGSFIRFDGDDQDIPCRFGFFEKIKVLFVEKVEKTSRKD